MEPTDRPWNFLFHQKGIVYDVPHCISAVECHLCHFQFLVSFQWTREREINGRLYNDASGIRNERPKLLAMSNARVNGCMFLVDN